MTEVEDEDDPGCENNSNKTFKTVVRQVGAFVAFLYDDHLYPGVLENIQTDGAVISAMQRSVKAWRWPEKEDQLFYEWKDIVGSINPPHKINKRGFFSVPELISYYTNE